MIYVDVVSFGDHSTSMELKKVSWVGDEFVESFSEARDVGEFGDAGGFDLISGR